MILFECIRYHIQRDNSSDKTVLLFSVSSVVNATGHVSAETGVEHGSSRVLRSNPTPQ